MLNQIFAVPYISNKNSSNSSHSKAGMNQLSLHIPLQVLRVLTKTKWVKPKISGKAKNQPNKRKIGRLNNYELNL